MSNPNTLWNENHFPYITRREVTSLYILMCFMFIEVKCCIEVNEYVLLLFLRYIHLTFYVRHRLTERKRAGVLQSSGSCRSTQLVVPLVPIINFLCIDSQPFHWNHIEFIFYVFFATNTIIKRQTPRALSRTETVILLFRVSSLRPLRALKSLKTLLFLAKLLIRSRYKKNSLLLKLPTKWASAQTQCVYIKMHLHFKHECKAHTHIKGRHSLSNSSSTAIKEFK